MFLPCQTAQSLDGFRTAFQRLVDKQESEAFSRPTRYPKLGNKSPRLRPRVTRHIHIQIRLQIQVLRGDSNKSLARQSRPGPTPGFYAELLHMLGMQAVAPADPF